METSVQGDEDANHFSDASIMEVMWDTRAAWQSSSVAILTLGFILENKSCMNERSAVTSDPGFRVFSVCVVGLRIHPAGPGSFNPAFVLLLMQVTLHLECNCFCDLVSVYGVGLIISLGSVFRPPLSSSLCVWCLVTSCLLTPCFLSVSLLWFYSPAFWSPPRVLSLSLITSCLH